MVTDNKGVEYQTDEYKTLVRAPEQLEFYTVPKSCEEILGGSKASDSPFYFCSSKISTIDFEASSNLQKIGKYSFASLTQLKTVDFNNCEKLSQLNDYAFSGCTSLNNLTLPPKLNNLNNYCFENCKSLTSFAIPDSVTKLGIRMIGGSGVKSLGISRNSNLVNIVTESFRQSPIASIFIPRNVSYIDGSSIMSCGNLNEITIHEDNPNYKIIGKCLYTTDEASLILTWETGDLIIPYKVTNLRYASLRGSRIKSIKFSGQTMTSFGEWFCSTVQFSEFRFPKGIKYIPYNGFSYSRIVSVYLTEEVNEIHSYAFQYCEQLQNIVLLNVTCIKKSAFLSCKSLKNISLPPMLTVIEQSAFGYCDNLIVDASKNPIFEIINGMLFIDQKKTLSEYFGSDSNIVIPSLCTKVGQSAFAAKSNEYVSFESTTTLELMSYAFDGSKLKEIKLPKCLIAIGTYCFNNCKNLEKVIFDIDCSLSNIQERCFYLCSALNELNIPKNIQTIGNHAFSFCSSLKTLDLMNTKLESIGESSFSQSGITKFVFPESFVSAGDNSFEKCEVETADFSRTSLYSIPQSCFSECKMLSTVMFSNFTNIIDILAFYKCQSLTKITLPFEIVTVESRSFEGCTSLESVTLTKNCMLETIKPRAFANCPNLIKIIVDETDEKFVFEKGALLSKDRLGLKFFLPSSKTSVFVVPSTVKTVGTSAFEECTNLRMIIFPDNGTSKIEFRAFAGCTQLKYVHLPDSLTSIGDQAFDGCKRLKCGSIYTSNLDSIKSMLDKINVDPITYSTTCSTIHTMRKCSKTSFSPIPIVMLVISQ